MKKNIRLNTRGRTKDTTDTWFTPKYIIDDLGHFDLDPCTEKTRPWPTARKHLTINENGLTHDWQGFVWCNPPYGNQTSIWLKKMANYNNGIALVFARTETKMFFDYVWPKASALLFIERRLSFFNIHGLKGKTNAGGPSVLIGYGIEAIKRLKRSSINGKLIIL